MSGHKPARFKVRGWYCTFCDEFKAGGLWGASPRCPNCGHLWLNAQGNTVKEIKEEVRTSEALWCKNRSH